MKIKIKDNQTVSKLNEDNNVQQGAQEAQTNSTFNAFEADAEYQYIIQRKKEALPVNIVLPQKFDLPVKLPTPPEDISNIMSSYQNNKARKTKNIGGVMQDPIQTYNHADACCRDAFGNFFGQAIKLQDNEKQQKLSKSYIHKSNESYNYDEFPVLNESAAATGVKIGTGIGSILGDVVAGTVGATAGLAATVGVQVAALGGAAYMLGYWGEEMFGNIESGGISNDKVAAHLNAKSQNMIKPTPSDPQKYTDIVEAIGVYVKDIMEACSDVAGVVNPEGAAKLDETAKFISGFMNTISKKANDFIETHSKELEDQKKLAQEKRENDLEKRANRSDKVSEFIKTSQNAWAEQAKGDEGLKELVLLQKIQGAYESAVKSSNNKAIDLKNALDENGWKGLKDKYNELYPSKHVNASATMNVNGERLNEEEGDTEAAELTNIKNEEHTAKAKTIIDAEKVYKSLLQEFELKFKEAFPKNIDGKKLPKYEETKEQMKALIDAADKSINSKIEQITKVQSGETSATGGLGQAAKTFLLGHPLESNNLREVWSRHLGDLNMRMTNRLQQMTDTNNKTRTLGWTIQVCRTVVPEILARMLTYRYIYAMLSNQGFFNYDTKTMEEDKKAFQNDKDVYINLPKSKLIWILNNQCLDYTSNNQQILTADPTNGGWTLSSSNNMSYAFFLVSKLYGSEGNISTCAKLGQFLSDIKSYVDEKDQVNQFLGTIMNALPNSSKNLLNDSDPAKFEQLANLFKMSDDIRNIKGEILATYQALTSQKVPTDHDKLVNIAKTLDLISKNPRNIYTAYIKNRGAIDELIEKVQAKSEITDELKKEIKNKIVDFFGESVDESAIKDKNYNDVTAESIQKLLPGNQANDYYSSILYMYPLQGLCIWDDEGKFMSHLSADGVKQVCKVVKDLLSLEFSGLLAYGLDEANKDRKNNNEQDIINAFKTIKDTCKNLQDINDAFNIIENSNDYSEDNQIYNEIKKLYDDKFEIVKSQIVNEFNKNTGKKLNIDSILNQDFIDAIIKFNGKFEYRVIADELKDIIFENNGKPFNELELNEQHKILFNLANAINSIKDLHEYRTLKDVINEIEEMAVNAKNTSNNVENESIICFNEKTYNTTKTNIYYLNENEKDIENGIDTISKDKNKAKNILAILNGKNENNKDESKQNNDEIIKCLNNMLNIVTSFSI